MALEAEQVSQFNQNSTIKHEGLIKENDIHNISDNYIFTCPPRLILQLQEDDDDDGNNDDDDDDDDDYDDEDYIL